MRAYADFVKKFGEIGAKALSSKEDLAVYEAIRLLSIFKEDPKATEEEVAAAEASSGSQVGGGDLCFGSDVKLQDSTGGRWSTA